MRAPRRMVAPFISSWRRSVRPMKLSFVVTTQGAMKTSSSSVAVGRDVGVRPGCARARRCACRSRRVAPRPTTLPAPMRDSARARRPGRRRSTPSPSVEPAKTTRRSRSCSPRRPRGRGSGSRRAVERPAQRRAACRARRCRRCARPSPIARAVVDDDVGAELDARRRSSTPSPTCEVRAARRSAAQRHARRGVSATARRPRRASAASPRAPRRPRGPRAPLQRGSRALARWRRRTPGTRAAAARRSAMRGIEMSPKRTLTYSP